MPDEIMPRDRAELLWDAIINHTIEAVDAIRDRPELIAAAIAAGLPDMLGNPRDRYEMFLKAIAGSTSSGIIDDSLAGYNILYSGENLTFNGTNSTAINTGIKLCESPIKDFRIVIKGLYQFYGSLSQYETILSCEKDDGGDRPGFRVGFGNFGYVNDNNIVYSRDGAGTRIDELVITYTNGAMSAAYANKTFPRALSIYVPDFQHQFETDAPVVIGCGMDGTGSVYRFCKGSLDSIVIAQK